MSGRVYFVGAGPGDPELMTVRGLKLVRMADTVIYAGSLVNREVLKSASDRADLFDSAKMHLDEITDVMVECFRSGKLVVRLQTGDTSLYGALQEQIRRLEQENIPFEIVPGVSSAFASIAALGSEFTLPEITQTVIFTRLEGRTPVPEKESLASLSSHRATICIFLSIGMIERVVNELSAGYPAETPVAVVFRASWPDEQIVRGTLGNIASRVMEAEITRTAMIIVGEVLGEEAKKNSRPSRLYCKDFAHDYRGKVK